MPKATFDKSRSLELHARIGQTGVPIILTFVNSDGSARPIDEEDFMLVVKKRPSSPISMFELEIGTGLTVIGPSLNKLKIDLTEAQSNQDPDTNFYTLISVEENHAWLNGPFKFHNGEYDGVEVTEEITISENGVEITITVESGGLVPATQAEMNAGTSSSVYATPDTVQDKDDDLVALVDAATIDITGPKHSLTTAVGREFTISHPGDSGVILLTLNAASAIMTFGAAWKGISEGEASGNNTVTLSGTSGDTYLLAWVKTGSAYTVAAKNRDR